MAEPSPEHPPRPLRWQDIAIAGFAATLVLLLVDGFVGYRNAGRLAQQNRWVDHSYQVLMELEGLLSTLKDAETGQRGYLLTADESYLQPCTDALRRLPGERAALRRLTADNPQQRDRLRALEPVLTTRLDVIRQTIDLAQQGNRTEAIALVRSDLGKRLMDDLRQRIAAMQVEERRLLARRAAESTTALRTLTGSILLTTLTGLVLVSVILALTLRHARARERAAALIAGQRERLRTTLASIGDAVIATDVEGRVTELNAVAAELTGWTRQEALGQPLDSVFLIVDEATRQPVPNPATRALREGVIVGLANHTILIARDGRERFIDDSAAPIRAQDGAVAGCVLVFRDIGDKRRAEVARFTELADTNRRQNEFLATLAHELRNPLAPIRNALEVIKLAQGDGETVATATAMIERQVGQMVRFVDDLLDVSRISRGKIELRKGRIELASAIHHAVEAAQPLCDSVGNELTLSLPAEPLYLEADPARIAQVVGNLLNNACKFTNRGGRIALAVEREGDQAVIRVRDTGIGLAAGELPRIFDLFMQVDTSLERTAGGLGIGLKLVQTLVDLHGGSVEAHSDGLGRGSEFVVRLPLQAAPAPASPLPRGPEPAPPTRHRVLVVDDNRDAATSLAKLLRLKGHDVRAAHDGLEAVAAAAEHRPDLVLCDLGMPKQNGYEVARQIRAQPWGQGIVLVAVTGWGQEEFRQRSKEAGFDGHLVKPVDAEEFNQLVASLDRSGAP